MEIDRRYLTEDPEPDLFCEKLEAILDQSALEVVQLPMNGTVPNVNVVFGVNRSATAAIATALLQLNYFSFAHSQPFKSARRNIWNIMSRGYGITYENDKLNLSGMPGNALLIKEANGGKRQCDYTKPFTYLLNATYPLDKLSGVIVWRSPLSLADSWARLAGWDNKTPTMINIAYRRTLDEINFASQSGVNLVEIFVSELKDSDVILETFQNVIDAIIPKEHAIEENVNNMIHWRADKSYDKYMLHYQKPPSKYIAGVSPSAGGKMQFCYQETDELLLFDNASRRERIRKELEEAYQIYFSRLATYNGASR